MRKISIGIAILVSALLTMPLIAISYLGKVALGLPFPPEDVYRWLLRADVDPFVAVYDWVASWATAQGQTLAQAQASAISIVSTTLFFLIGVLVGVLFYLLAGRKTFTLDWVDGVAIGALFSTPFILASINGRFSPLHPLLQAVWLALLFVAWGIALSAVYGRLGRLEALPSVAAAMPDVLHEEDEDELAVTTPAGEETKETLAAGESGIGRRQFLLRLGASTAAITAISGVAAAALNTPERAAAQRLALPMADPETVEFYNQTFRRFSIVQIQPGAAEGEVNVLALGTEYPDHQYVSLWIGEQSPIVVYENVETALMAYRNRVDDSGNVVDIIWLDG